MARRLYAGCRHKHVGRPTSSREQPSQRSSDAPSERLEPLITAAKPGGRPRRPTCARRWTRFSTSWAPAVHGGISRAACSSHSTVYDIFRQFQRDGVSGRISEGSDIALREALDREASPSTAIIDSQSLKRRERGAASRGERTAAGAPAGR